MRIYNIYTRMKRQKKTKVVNFRLTEKELEVLENIANSFHTDLTKAVVRSLALTESYLLKADKYQRIKRKNEIMFSDEQLEIADINWLEDGYFI